MVRSPANIFVVAPADPNEVNPVRDELTPNVGIGPDKSSPSNPAPIVIAVRSPPPSAAFTILLFESKPR